MISFGCDLGRGVDGTKCDVLDWCRAWMNGNEPYGEANLARAGDDVGPWPFSCIWCPNRICFDWLFARLGSTVKPGNRDYAIIHSFMIRSTGVTEGKKPRTMARALWLRKWMMRLPGSDAPNDEQAARAG
jgi:hypothetical protein